MRVLIAEDNSVSRKLLSKLIEPHGQVVQAANGEECLKEYYRALETKQTIDLIILDMVMPKVSGIGVLEEIRKHEQQHNLSTQAAIPIIMLTGKGEADQIGYAKSLGISDYMLKPIDRSRLLRELQRLKLIPDPGDQWE